MIRYPVISTRIASVGYQDEILEIQFKDGAIYHYYNVSQNTYNWFINSPSLGHSLSILTKKHCYQRIS